MAGIVLGGRYELIREIGRGGSATVYLAHDRALDRQIAVKLIAPALANDPGFLDRFMREARISAGLSHPNILTVHDVGESDDHRPFLAISLVDGESLEQVIAQSGRLPLAEAARILGQLAAALDYLHAAGLIHRDVKPSNVLVEESGRVLLSDFGIAYARESTRYTATGMLLGTPRYMAPEQMRGDEPSPQTDVYAMGVVAFEMLAGVPPFEGTGTGLMYQIVHEPPPSLRAKVPDAPPGIEAVIARALEKDSGRAMGDPRRVCGRICGGELKPHGRGHGYRDWPRGGCGPLASTSTADGSGERFAGRRATDAGRCRGGGRATDPDRCRERRRASARGRCRGVGWKARVGATTHGRRASGPRRPRPRARGLLCRGEPGWEPARGRQRDSGEPRQRPSAQCQHHRRPRRRLPRRRQAGPRCRRRPLRRLRPPRQPRLRPRLPRFPVRRAPLRHQRRRRPPPRRRHRRT